MDMHQSEMPHRQPWVDGKTCSQQERACCQARGHIAHVAAEDCGQNHAQVKTHTPPAHLPLSTGLHDERDLQRWNGALLIICIGACKEGAPPVVVSIIRPSTTPRLPRHLSSECRGYNCNLIKLPKKITHQWIATFFLVFLQPQYTMRYTGDSEKDIGRHSAHKCKIAAWSTDIPVKSPKNQATKPRIQTRAAAGCVCGG